MLCTLTILSVYLRRKEEYRFRKNYYSGDLVKMPGFLQLEDLDSLGAYGQLLLPRF